MLICQFFSIHVFPILSPLMELLMVTICVVSTVYYYSGILVAWSTNHPMKAPNGIVSVLFVREFFISTNLVPFLLDRTRQKGIDFFGV